MDDQKSLSLPAAVEQHYGQLTAFLTKKLSCPALGKELVHEANIRVRGLREQSSLENPLAYLYRIVINLALDHRRNHEILHQEI